MLRDFEVFVTDDRYAVPTLYIIHAPGPMSARALAEQLVADSPHHLSAEVFDGAVRLFILAAAAQTTPAAAVRGADGAGLMDGDQG